MAVGRRVSSLIHSTEPSAHQTAFLSVTEQAVLTGLSAQHSGDICKILKNARKFFTFKYILEHNLALSLSSGLEGSHVKGYPSGQV